jgi:signal transduction histidine kinase/ligand-binding sensor domain-containing protein
MLRLSWFARAALSLLLPVSLLALDPNKALTQYTQTVWTQAQGLPQDTVRAITQTNDGYLWLGTSEGLARFDGYEFVPYTKATGALPGDSVTELCTGKNGVLWIGTNGGVARYADGQFRTFSVKDGMPPGTVTSLAEDTDGALWIVAGGVLSRLQDDKFVTYSPESLAPVASARVVYKDGNHLWVGGVGGVVEKNGDTFSPVRAAADWKENIITCILRDASGLWLAGTQGAILIQSDGQVKRFSKAEGLLSVVALCKDRSGNLWLGTEAGLSRIRNGRLIAAKASEGNNRERVWSLFEDREGDLWAGMYSSLHRFRDDRFITYGRPEGLPSDNPSTVHQDQRGQIWIGYSDGGLAAFDQGRARTFTSRDGLPSNQVNSIRDLRNGGLLLGTAGGLSRWNQGVFSNYQVPDPVGRPEVNDAIEDFEGNLWTATSGGVYEFNGKQWTPRIQEGTAPSNIAVVLAQTHDGSIWAGTLLNGLWQVTNGKSGSSPPRLYTTRDQLGSNQIRSLYEDAEGTLWIGTLGGGLNTFRDGVFHRYTARDGLPSDNIAHVEDDGRGSLWLSTPRGICRIAKRQLEDFRAGKIRVLTPENFGIADGLRSAQCAPSFPAGGGGTRTSDGRLWFPTGLGVATLDPSEAAPKVPLAALTPAARIVEVSVGGRLVDSSQQVKLRPGVGQIQFRYAGIYLAAPERVHYAFKLEGLDPDWVSAGRRRSISYNPLPHGSYRFVVRAMLPGGGTSESAVAFEVLPRFFETQAFRWMCGILIPGLIYGAYRLRLRRIHSRFALVFEERARMAREIHDTLAQGFVGISHQLDALAIKFNGDKDVARGHLDLARRMARHSLTEARRSVMDLRTTELENQDLPAALEASARRWAAGSSVDVQLQITGVQQKLPAELELNLLRIAQEAVANAMKHARASMIRVELAMEGRSLRLGVKDDGQGFEPAGTFSLIGGHFGIVGMRERAQRLGGRFSLSSSPGSGTEVEVSVPLASSGNTNNSRN